MVLEMVSDMEYSYSLFVSEFQIEQWSDHSFEEIREKVGRHHYGVSQIWINGPLCFLDVSLLGCWYSVADNSSDLHSLIFGCLSSDVRLNFLSSRFLQNI